MQYLEERFHEVIGVIMASTNLKCRHAAEQGSGPPCIVSGLLMIPVGLSYGPLITYVVTGIEFLALEYRSAVYARECGK
jgi:hypothetical protein